MKTSMNEEIERITCLIKFNFARKTFLQSNSKSTMFETKLKRSRRKSYNIELKSTVQTRTAIL